MQSGIFLSLSSTNKISYFATLASFEKMKSMISPSLLFSTDESLTRKDIGKKKSLILFPPLSVFSVSPKVQIIRQSSKNPLKPRLSRHPLNISVADKKYFYHYCITSHFLVFLGISGFVSLCKFLLSGITWFIFA